MERTLVRFVFFFLFGVVEKKEGVGSEGGLGKKAKGERGEGTDWLADTGRQLPLLAESKKDIRHSPAPVLAHTVRPALLYGDIP